MPGKGDYGIVGTSKGQYYPGSNEWRAWDEGWRARYDNDLITTNPFGAGRPVEQQAWNDGWTSADQNTAGTKRMPATTGPVPVITTMPNVVGQLLTVVTTTLADEGIEVGTVTGTGDTVLTQSVPPDTEVAFGSSVDLTV